MTSAGPKRRYSPEAIVKIELADHPPTIRSANFGAVDANLRPFPNGSSAVPANVIRWRGSLPPIIVKRSA